MESTYSYEAPSTYSDDEKMIWKVLIYNDFVAFCTKNWQLIADDFVEEGFFGIDGKRSPNKKDWSLTYPSLDAYKQDWIKQSEEFNKKTFLKDPLDILFTTTKLSKIEIIGTTALVHKEFDGIFTVADDSPNNFRLD